MFPLIHPTVCACPGDCAAAADADAEKSVPSATFGPKCRRDWKQLGVGPVILRYTALYVLATHLGLEPANNRALPTQTLP